jgi:hypothetical protein
MVDPPGVELTHGRIASSISPDRLITTAVAIFQGDHAVVRSIR